METNRHPISKQSIFADIIIGKIIQNSVWMLVMNRNNILVYYTGNNYKYDTIIIMYTCIKGFENL